MSFFPVKVDAFTRRFLEITSKSSIIDKNREPKNTFLKSPERHSEFTEAL